MQKVHAFLSLPLLFILPVFLFNCNNQEQQKNEGEALSKKYCISCHAYPEPQLLSRAIWKNNILPEMAAFANLYKNDNEEYHPMNPAMIRSKSNVVGSIAFTVTIDEWNQLVNYYVSNAPEQLPVNHMSVDTLLSNFEILTPAKTSGKPYTSSIYYSPSAKKIVIANMNGDSLKLYNSDLQYEKSLNTAKGVVDILEVNATGYSAPNLLLTHIGNFRPMPPPMNRNGFVELLNMNNTKVGKKLVDSLDRPVKTILTDVNNDKLKDIIVCQFGYIRGELTLFVNNGKEYTKKTLSPLPGAIQIYEDDINKDGLPDFWVLFAGAYEGIVQFINKGDTNFEQRTVASFPPSYGSTYFELVDFNNDGKKDILYTCGDNADNSQELKPYHGIYLFENTGDSYKQINFFPLNGCYKANMIDYDLDGDLDIAAIAFFADYEKHPEQGFVYLENKGNNDFSARTFPSSSVGRWICMESVDYDGDGDMDILLGNLAAKPGNNRDMMIKWLNGPEFIVLQNKTKKR